MSSYEYEIQALYEANVLPANTLSQSAATRLTAAKRVLDQNYYEVKQYINGDLETNPVYICPEDSREDAGFEVLRLLHNYLSSLYSFNETIRVVFNQNTADGVELTSGSFTPATGGTEESYYARKLSFLRGLRTDFQHGGFSSLSFEKVGDLGNFAGYHVEFDSETFVEDSGLRDPKRFLRHTNGNEQRYPLCFIEQFQTGQLQSFYHDVEEWFD
ncbi:hypothetical protein [Halorussus salinus]|uniref:hypothetical protein n=1 Tax=Halorussus salinus TaxID=1364935 RepID=UPI00109325D6|nr:hypothetical protein [Halorussus salinus]